MFVLVTVMVNCKKKETASPEPPPVHQTQSDYRDAYAGRYAVTFTCTSFYLGTSTKIYNDTLTVRKAKAPESLPGVHNQHHDSTMVADSIGFLHNGFIYKKTSFTTLRNGVGTDYSEHIDLRNGMLQYWNGRDSKSHTKASGIKLP